MGLDTYAARKPLARDVYEITDEACALTRRDLWALQRAQRKRERANDGYCVFERKYFRGKLYDNLVEYVTGVSLAQWWIPPETVAEMAERFRERESEEIAAGFKGTENGYYEPSDVEVADLAAFLDVCARRRLGLVGSM
jgi:hypothetical protein